MLEKTLGKLEISGDIGQAIDTQLSITEHKSRILSGKIEGLAVASSLVLKLLPHIQSDCIEGKIQLPVNNEELFEILKIWITRASECLLNLQEKNKADLLVCNGEIEALRTSVLIIQNYHNKIKLEAEELIKEKTIEIKNQTPKTENIQETPPDIVKNPLPHPTKRKRK